MSDFGHGSKIIALFEPRRLDTLRDCMMPLIGKMFTFEWVGEMEGGIYDGQFMWVIDRAHDSVLSEDCRGRWVPGEDLKVLEIVR